MPRIVFGDDREIYLLGELKFNMHPFNSDHPPTKGKVYLYYEREFDSIQDVALEERVSMQEVSGSLILGANLQQRFQQHPYIGARDYWDVVRTTKKGGRYSRFMEYPLDQGGKPREKKRCDYSDWDKRILKRCASLPAHVKRVLGL